MQLNHVFRSRDLVMKNDAKVSKRQETDDNEILADDNFLDHGFTRPKVYKRHVLVIIYWTWIFYFYVSFNL